MEPSLFESLVQSLKEAKAISEQRRNKMKLSDTIRKLDCVGNLSLKVAMFQIADEVEASEQGFHLVMRQRNELALSYCFLKVKRDALVAELAALREQKSVAHPLITDAELKLIMSMRSIKEKHGAQIVGIDLADGNDRTVSAVFAAPKEDFKDWPEDRGEHPQKGLGK